MALNESELRRELDFIAKEKKKVQKRINHKREFLKAHHPELIDPYYLIPKSKSQT